MVCVAFWCKNVEFRHLTAYTPPPSSPPICISFTVEMENITFKVWLESVEWREPVFHSQRECASRTEQIIGRDESAAFGNGHCATSCVCDSLRNSDWRRRFYHRFLRPGGAGREAEDLLECLWEEEALLHVVVADRRGVNVADAREARLDSAVLLQGLAGDGNTLKHARQRDSRTKERPHFYKNTYEAACMTFKWGVEHP